MKGYRLPLSEDFVYSSPERPTGGSYRWIGTGKRSKSCSSQVVRGRRHEPKRKA